MGGANPPHRLHTTAAGRRVWRADATHEGSPPARTGHRCDGPRKLPLRGVLVEWRRLLGKDAKRAASGRPDRRWERRLRRTATPPLVKDLAVELAGVTGYQPALAAAWKRANPLPGAAAVMATASLLPGPTTPTTRNPFGY